MNDTTFADKVLSFNKLLSKINIDLPKTFSLVNPFVGDGCKQIEKITNMFYNKFYSDKNKRIMILGSSPARRGTAITGIPYEDAEHLYSQTGICVEEFYVNKASSNFLYEVIERYGGCEKFYSKFYMNFVCPLGIVKTNEKGHNVNCNYYDNKLLEHSLYDFMINSLKKQLTFNIDTKVCYCIGSGANFEFLTKINGEYKFFDRIIPLEHPRFIMQYNSKDKEKFLRKYLELLQRPNC
jgi:hypothetical protein